MVQEKIQKFSKMTFAHLSQATAESQRVFHRTQNTFNRIQNSLLTIEIHDQGKLNTSCTYQYFSRHENQGTHFFIQHKRHFAGLFQYQQ